MSYIEDYYIYMGWFILGKQKTRLFYDEILNICINLITYNNNKVKVRNLETFYLQLYKYVFFILFCVCVCSFTEIYLILIELLTLTSFFVR